MNPGNPSDLEYYYGSIWDPSRLSDLRDQCLSPFYVTLCVIPGFCCLLFNVTSSNVIAPTLSSRSYNNFVKVFVLNALACTYTTFESSK